MKTQTDKTQEPKNSITPRIASESSDRGTAQLMDNRTSTIDQRKLQETMNTSTENGVNPIQRKANKTGLPDNLKTGIENLSSYSMDDVKVHYNSSKPAQLQAHAYAQGTDIHLAPGQEKHLPHEAWHVVQQKQGRVKPTMQFKGKVNINDDEGLEKEADLMGTRAIKNSFFNNTFLKYKEPKQSLAQRVIDYGNLNSNAKIENAVRNYEQLEQPGLKKRFFLNPFQLGYGRYKRNSALFSRFRNARGTTLKFVVRRESGVSLAITRLYGRPMNSNSELEYDNPVERQHFDRNLQNRNMQSFKVVVLVNPRFIRSFTDGNLLQTITHEMTVHAENLLDFIEKYWKYHDDANLANFTAILPSATQEHQNFKNGNVVSYNRLKSRLENSSDLNLRSMYNDFSARETLDFTTC